ncbi:MAG: anaerobic ribonucleoside-triphosphate reductase activating protein [Planctomycetes bacterium]|jgi:pyruvate formate lyase activating enzyme|nr:anaerobic ribonucleoside-triphosphate reductase activating protein [Planctomycetota bacterium]
MEIGGLQKFSLLDYPGQIAAVIFLPGCNFRCHFCYNPMLVWPQRQGKLKNTISSDRDERPKDHPTLIAEGDLFVFLKKRQGKIDAVVISGGEPTVHPDLPEFINKLKEQSLKVKLDTNGTNTVMLKELLKKKFIDYVAMDVKAPPSRYEAVAGAPVPLSRVKESIKIIKKSGRPYEFRTTLVPGLVGKEDISGIGELIRGGKNWFLQKFKSDTDLVGRAWKKTASFSDEEMEEMRSLGAKYVMKCEWR